jgi:hypothetical protein
VIGVEQGLFDQPEDVVVVSRVEHAVPVAADPHQPSRP